MNIAVLFYRVPRFSTEEAFHVMFDAHVVEPAKYDLVLVHEVSATLSTEDLLNLVWRMTQNDNFENGWRFRFQIDSPCRSSMVGDIFMVGDNFHVVDKMGFRQLTADEMQPFQSWMDRCSPNHFLLIE